MAKAPQNKTEEPQPAPAAAFSNRSRNLLTVGLVGGLMILEGVAIVFAIRLTTPAPAAASGSTAGDVDPGVGILPDYVEIPVTDLMAYNSRQGEVVVYQLSVFADIEYKYHQKVQDLFESRHNTINDRLGKVIRAADPKYLNEPGLETLQRQVKHELDQILGDDTLIKKVLFPEFSAARAD